jgi:hypothetical protein
VVAVGGKTAATAWAGGTYTCVALPEKAMLAEMAITVALPSLFPVTETTLLGIVNQGVILFAITPPTILEAIAPSHLKNLRRPWAVAAFGDSAAFLRSFFLGISKLYRQKLDIRHCFIVRHISGGHPKLQHFR